MHQESRPAAGCPIGVVIPTFNRADVLLLCLRRLEEQVWRNFEVVVVDDGSTDGTREQMESYAAKTPLRLSYVRQENSGPARARNLGISLLRSPVCLMIGDDILASPGLVQQHLALHQRRPEPHVAGLGLTRWSEQEQTVTPFMRWLDRDGFQFAYNDLFRGVAPGWRHFYTSNLSLKTDYLRDNPFHEGFRAAAMEDLELGYRLEKTRGLEVAFLPEALAGHLHPTSVSQACRRMIGVGAALHQFELLWPETRSLASAGPVKRRLISALQEERWVLPRLRDFAALLTRLWGPTPLLKQVLLLHNALGYRKARENVEGLNRLKPAAAASGRARTR